MKIICAGYNRTGTKSCSRALEILDFKVADLYETAECLSDVWLDFLNGKVKIENVISEYKANGFNVNQDLPGNIHWHDLYKASPRGTKVILTVRDSDQVWYESLSRFVEHEYTSRLVGNDFSTQRLFGNMTKNGFLGDKMKNMVKIYSKIIPIYFSPRCDDFYNPYWYISSWRKQYSKFEMELKQNYNRHNQNVIDNVPKEDLLVWNLKDGWRPICEFLGKPIPSDPFPILNDSATGTYVEDIVMDKKVIKDSISELKKNLGLSLVTFGIYAVYLSYRK